jgi:ABC-2 type transport system permease protein
MVNAFRYGFLGVTDVSMAHAFSMIIGIIVILTVWVAILFRSGAGLKR